MNDHPIRGVWCATLTPLEANGEIDRPRWREHVQALFAGGVDGIAPFGTTGEGQSFSLSERRHGVEALIADGVDARRIAPATGCAAIGETIQLTRHAVESGCVGALVLPPFFYKNIGDDGVFESYARLIEGVRDSRLRLYLYHIPQVTGVPIGHGAIERLLQRFPGIVAGIKDSSGDLAHSLELVRRFPSLDVFVGHEPHLPRLLAAGGAGTICGIANLYPDVLRALHDANEDESRASALEFVTRVIEIVKAYSLMPAIKAVRAILSADPAWYAVRPPLVALDEPARRTLAASIAGLAPSKAAA